MTQTLPIAPKEFWYGEPTQFSWPTVALLNSPQSFMPHGGEEWVKTTVHAATWVAGKEYTLLSGIGAPNWELAAWACGQALGRLVLLVPLRATTSIENAQLILQRFLDDLGLIRQQTLLIPYWETPATRGEALWPARDRWILENAKHLFSVSLQPEGSLSSALDAGDLSGNVDERFRVPFAPHHHSFQPAPETFDRALEETLHDFAIHWIAPSPLPWPCENKDSFYRAVVESIDSSHHNGPATLRMFLREMSIFGTSAGMPFGKKMVSFRRADFDELRPFMNDKNSTDIPAMEPFGIAVRIDALKRLGGKNVRRGSASETRSLTLAQRLFFEPVSAEASVFPGEELRIRGDFDLTKCKKDEVLVLVPDHSNRNLLARQTDFVVRSLVR